MTHDPPVVVPEHYRASRDVVGGGPLRELGSVGLDPIGLAHRRADAVDLVQHVNDAHSTILFHAAGGRANSEACNRFRADGVGWPGEALHVPVGAYVRCRWSEPTE